MVGCSGLILVLRLGLHSPDRIYKTIAVKYFALVKTGQDKTDIGYAIAEHPN